MPTIANGFSLFSRDLDHVDEVLGEDRAGLSGARVLITGATGFFGIWVTEALLHIGRRHGLDIEVVGLTRDAGRFLKGKGSHLSGHSGLSFIEGSVTSFEAPGRFSHILHLASESNPDNSPDWTSRHLTSTVEGTRRLLDLAAERETDGILLTTSGAVYLGAEPMVSGRFAELPREPADLTSEKSVYGQAKRMMEVMGAVSAAATGRRVLIARCFAFVGPYLALDANYAIGNFIRDALAGREIVVGGDGTPLRSYLYAADLAGQLLKLLLRGRSAVPYNIGGEEIVAIGDLAQRVARIAGTGSSVVVMQAPKPGAVANSYVPDIGRIADELRLAPALSLDEGIARTIEWHRRAG